MNKEDKKSVWIIVAACILLAVVFFMVPLSSHYDVKNIHNRAVRDGTLIPIGSDGLPYFKD